MSRANSTNWCFTLFDEDYDAPKALPYRYLVYQLEITEQGREHIQGYVVLKKKMTMVGLKKILPSAHWEVRRGTHKEAKDYCRKKESRTAGPWEFGSESGVAMVRGQRTDLMALKDDLDKKIDLPQIAQKHFASFMRYERGIRSYMNLQTGHRNQNTTPIIKIYWGPSGTGKTRRAIDEHPDCYVMQKGEWWPDYSGQQVVLFDEFYSWIPYDQILRILDRYPYAVPYKGGFTKLTATIFLFTSNQSPDKWYSKIKNREALNRRFAEWGTIYHMEELYNPQQPMEIQDVTPDFESFAL